MTKNNRGSSSVPALERGLLVLERLSLQHEAVTLSEIARLCGLTVATVQRTVACLQQTGYLVRESTGGYIISSKLFRVAHHYPPYRDLLSVALPAMHAFTAETGESVHLAVLASDQMQIIGQVEADGIIRLSVKVGSLHDPLKTVSGLILLAGRSDAEIAAFQTRRQLPPARRRQLKTEIRQIRQDAFVFRPSSVCEGVWDLGVPVKMPPDAVIAALTTTFLQPRLSTRNRDVLLKNLQACAREISSPDRSRG